MRASLDEGYARAVALRARSVAPVPSAEAAAEAAADACHGDERRTRVPRTPPTPGSSAAPIGTSRALEPGARRSGSCGTNGVNGERGTTVIDRLERGLRDVGRALSLQPVVGWPAWLGRDAGRAVDIARVADHSDRRPVRSKAAGSGRSGPDAVRRPATGRRRSAVGPGLFGAAVDHAGGGGRAVLRGRGGRAGLHLH